jgi:hypothetical protein
MAPASRTFAVGMVPMTEFEPWDEQDVEIEIVHEIKCPYCEWGMETNGDPAGLDAMAAKHAEDAHNGPAREAAERMLGT